MTTKTNNGNNKYLDLDSLIDTALQNPTTLNAKILMLVELLEDVIECIKEIEPDKYPKYYIKLSKLIHGYYVTEDIYDYAVSLMKNVDGSVGAKLTKEKIKECAAQHGIVSNTMVSDFDIAYIASMYMSDNWDKSLSDDENIAFAMKATKGFLTDPDAPQVAGRALRFFVELGMWKPKVKK